MTTAKRRAIDAIRRDKMRERKHEEIARELGGVVNGGAEAIEVVTSDDLGDELLGLIFTACHPVPFGRRSRCAHAACGRRPDDGRDRPCLPVERGDDRPTNRPRQEDNWKGRPQL